MKFDPIDILPILLLLIGCIGLKPVFEKGRFNEDYLSVDTGRTYRGFFCLAVIYHHLAGRSEGGVIFRNFTEVGYLSVAVFFFLSGYGLIKSFVKSPDYKKGFLVKRLSKILIPYTILNFVFWAVEKYEGNNLDIAHFVRKLYTGHPVVTFSWFVTNIILAYLLFYILMHLCKDHYNLIILLMIVGVIAYDIFCVRMEYARAWYNANQLIPIGMFWALHEKKILEFIKKHYWIITILTWIVFLLVFRYRKPLAKAYPVNGFGLSLIMISASLFVIALHLLNLKIKIGNPLIRFLGDISLETYLVQGLFIIYMRSDYYFIEDELTWVIISIVGSVVAGAILHYVSLGILSLFKRKPAEAKG